MPNRTTNDPDTPGVIADVSQAERDACGDRTVDECAARLETLRGRWESVRSWLSDHEPGADGFPVEGVEATRTAQLDAAAEVWSRIDGAATGLREAREHAAQLAAIRANAAPPVPAADPTPIGVRVIGDRIDDATMPIRIAAAIERAPGPINEGSSTKIAIPLRGLTNHDLLQAAADSRRHGVQRAVLTTADGGQEVRLPMPVVPVGAADEPLSLFDVLAPEVEVVTAAGSGVEYLAETTASAERVPKAAETAEGADSPEAAWDVGLKTAKFVEVPVKIPLTKLALRSVPALRPFIEQRMPTDIRRRLNDQLVTGTGVSPLLLGLAKVVGTGAVDIDVTAAGLMTTPVAKMRRAITKQRFDGGAGRRPIFLMAPAVWDTILTMQETSTAGQFINGGLVNAEDETLRRIPVLQHDGYTEVGTDNAKLGALIDLAFIKFWVQESAEPVLEFGYDDDDFGKRQLTALCVLTVAFAVTRAESVVSLTENTV